jgi:polyisoprenoid-binding protein YceI
MTRAGPRSKDWLDVQQHPQLTYYSSRIEFDGDG